MGLIVFSHQEKPMGWNMHVMGLLRNFATASEQDTLREEVFQPYDHGLNAIWADKMSSAKLSSFIDLLERFMIAAPDTLKEHVQDAIEALQKEKELKCPP